MTGDDFVLRLILFRFSFHHRLESLIISENKIKSIFFPDCKPTEKTAYFPKLKALIIKRNDISGVSKMFFTCVRFVAVIGKCIALYMIKNQYICTWDKPIRAQSHITDAKGCGC